MNEEETMIWNWGKKKQMHEQEGVKCCAGGASLGAR
jgi:hypothetical protein